MSYKLSICIVAYNNYDEIKTLINSMNKFTNKELNKKLFIVDNGVNISDGKDVDDFKSFISCDEDIEYIDAGENIGFGKAHNKVINIIDSEYHAIVNPDIIFCEDAFSNIINWMDDHQDVGMTIPLIVDNNNKRQEVYRQELTLFDMFNRMFLKEFFKKRAYNHSLRYKNFNTAFEVPFGQGSFLVIRTSIFKKINGFDENFFMYVEDADLCKRVNLISKLMYYPGAKVIHKWEKGSHKNISLFKYHISSAIYYFKKWGWKFI